MKEPTYDGVKLIGFTAVAMIVIGIIVTLVLSAKDSTESVMKQANDKVSVLVESQYTQYDGETVRGSDVINCIKSHAKDVISISVDNGIQETTYLYTADLQNKSDAQIKDAKSKTNLSLYIDPNQDFLGEVLYDEAGTGTILGLKFVLIKE